jgi:HK97 family phage major capsid protein
MSVEVKPTEQGANAELSAVLEGLKSIEGATGEQKSKIEAIQKDIDAYEEKNKELTLKSVEAANELKAAQERLETLELAIAQKSVESPQDYRESTEYKAFNSVIKSTAEKEFVLSDAERKTLRTDSGTNGGYLVPTVLSQDIAKQIEEISDVRRLARVRAIPGVKSLELPVRTGIPNAHFEGELEEGQQSNSTYGLEMLTNHAVQVEIPVSRDLISYSSFDILGDMELDAVLAFAQAEGRNFIKGSGVKTPEGILTNSKVPTVDTANSGKISYTDVILLSAKIKKGYNPVYFLTRETLAYLKTEREGTDNGYLWKAGIGDQPNTINEYPYVIMQDMDKLTGLTGQTAGDIVVGFGDFYSGYSILDNTNFEIVQDPYSQKSKRMIEYIWFRYLTGKVVLPEAFALLKIKA